MLKDIFICPQVFTEPTLNSSNWKDIKYLLENIMNSGYIVAIKRKKWIRDTNGNISRLEPKVKYQLLELIKVLKSRERIVEHPIFESNIDEESGWLNYALQLNEKRHLFSILSSSALESTLTLEQLEEININEKFGVTGSKRFTLSSENIEKLLIPFLSYAKKITIIDPYFYIHESRYEDSLRIIAKLLGERRGEKQACTIIVNCKWADKINTNGRKEKWEKTIFKIKNESGQSIEINCWEEQEGSIKMHDRYLITNQSGLVSAAGTNIDENQQSEWSIKDYREQGDVLSQYKSNSSPFNLMYKISTEE